MWRLPAYNIVHNILTNPICAVAYAFGRTTSRISVADGRKRIRRGVHRPMAEWDVLIKDHHEAYISWDEFERNLKTIANNATGMTSALARGAAREGERRARAFALRPLRRKLHVHYGGSSAATNAMAHARSTGLWMHLRKRLERGRRDRQGGASSEAARQEAAIKAIEAQSSETTATERQLQLSLQQARYEAAHARLQ